MPSYSAAKDLIPSRIFLEDELDAYAQKVYRAEKTQVEDKNAGTIVLAGLKDNLQFDGLLRSVAWTVGPNDTAKTEIEWGKEIPKPEIPVYEERRERKAASNLVARIDAGDVLVATSGTSGTKTGGTVPAVPSAKPRREVIFDSQMPTHVQLGRNTTSTTIPAGRPAAYNKSSPVGDDGIWNLVLPSSYTNFPVFLVTLVDIAPGETGRVYPTYGGDLGWVDISNDFCDNAVVGHVIDVRIGYFEWMLSFYGSYGLGPIVKICKQGSKKTALVLFTYYHYAEAP
jgi:hypothetical protein